VTAGWTAGLTAAHELLLGALPPAGVCAFLAVAAPTLARRLPPRTAAPLLTALALTTALACGLVLAAGALTAIAPTPALAALGHWSPVATRSGDPLPVWAGIPLAALVSVLLARGLLRAWSVARDLAAAEVTCRRLGPGVGGLVIVDAYHADAYTLPGLTGRMVVSTAMLRALPSGERRALLAHEASHLRQRHYAYIQLSELAAAANPLLRPVPAAVRRAVERWADEDAAREVGDRPLAARALARAALARRRADGPAVAATALGAATVDVADRVRALLAPAPPPRRLLAATTALLILLVLAGAALTERVTERHFEQARAAYWSAQHPATP
jgi:Zn-dependent protease with chaperone function